MWAVDFSRVGKHEFALNWTVARVELVTAFNGVWNCFREERASPPPTKGCNAGPGIVSCFNNQFIPKIYQCLFHKRGKNNQFIPKIHQCLCHRRGKKGLDTMYTARLNYCSKPCASYFRNYQTKLIWDCPTPPTSIGVHLRGVARPRWTPAWNRAWNMSHVPLVSSHLFDYATKTLTVWDLIWIRKEPITPAVWLSSFKLSAQQSQNQNLGEKFKSWEWFSFWWFEVFD